MQLIGMLDSPYVRRAAISLECLGIPFEHRAVSVFSTFEKFQSINPVVKAPTLICDDGEVLMDSSFIIQLAEAKAAGKKSLWSNNPVALQNELRAVSFALAACEKSVQIIYEQNWRPEEKQYAPWITRLTGQLIAAYAGLEAQVQKQGSMFNGQLNQPSITAATAWQFTQSMLAHSVPASKHPGLVALSAKLEQSAEFKKYPPVGPGVPRPPQNV